MAVTMEQAKANFKEAKRQFYNTQIKELFKDGYSARDIYDITGCVINVGTVRSIIAYEEGRN